jgi:hypothetical protein
MTPSNKSFCSMAKRIRRHYLTTLIILSLGFGIVNGQPRTPGRMGRSTGCDNGSGIDYKLAGFER